MSEDRDEIPFELLCERLGGEVALLRAHWREFMRQYAGQNIAICRGRVVASGDHYRETVALAASRGWTNPFIAKLPRGGEQREESREGKHQADESGGDKSDP